MKYRIVDVASGVEHEVIARTPEDAAYQIYPEPLVRGAPNGHAMLAKVYFEYEGQLTLVKFYRPKSATTSPSRG